MSSKTSKPVDAIVPIKARILYWGIAGAGKTTNLRSIRAKLRSDNSGELRHEPTRIDPTVTYEVLPIQLGDVGGRPTQIEIVAVPDGEEQAPTRKQLLDEVSGVVLVINSEPGLEDANVASRNELVEAFASYGRDLTEIPVIVQYNKRDLADENHIEALHRRIALPSAAVFEAIATEGSNVLQTLTTISKRVVKKMRDKPAGREDRPTDPTENVDVALAAEARAKMAGKAAPIYDLAALEQRAQPLAPTLSTTEMLEAAIEADLTERADLAERGLAAPDVLDLEARGAFSASYEELANEDKPASNLRFGADLRIVSVGTASREGERSLRIPIVLGDASGATASIALSIALDPLLDPPHDGSGDA